jgi:hypothetical protein
MKSGSMRSQPNQGNTFSMCVNLIEDHVGSSEPDQRAWTS